MTIYWALPINGPLRNRGLEPWNARPPVLWRGPAFRGTRHGPPRHDGGETPPRPHCRRRAGARAGRGRCDGPLRDGRARPVHM
eukprot:763744-Lingulodinium_polyedra.AAC.1